MKTQMKIGQTLLVMSVLSACGDASGEFGAQPWMSRDVEAAWDKGYKGQGATITVVDEYNSETFAGKVTGENEFRSHGDWTALQSGMIAPESEVRQVDYFRQSNTGYALADGLNVVNNSYSIEAGDDYTFSDFDLLEQTTIVHAEQGTAVVVKAAGNESVAVDGNVGFGRKDVFNTHLVGADTAIFVGALDKNGSTSDPTQLAGYSNYAGTNPTIQEQFLVVGVDQAEMGLEGTSFAAPIVSGYAAILGSKFKSATPKQITDQLLGTARTDTIQGYTPILHGQGEASLDRALAPNSLQ